MKVTIFALVSLIYCSSEAISNLSDINSWVISINNEYDLFEDINEILFKIHYNTKQSLNISINGFNIYQLNHNTCINSNIIIDKNQFHNQIDNYDNIIRWNKILNDN